MRKTLLPIFAMCLFIVGSVAQDTFFDDFESYNDGDLIGAASNIWATWGGAGGGADDAPVTTEQAFSGTKSLRLFSNSANGGPADVILPFGGQRTEGLFVFETMMFVTKNSVGYFNFQGNPTPGQIWSAEFYFLEDGTIRISNSPDGILLNSGPGAYEQGEWYKFTCEADLTVNTWTIFLNDVALGSFENSNNFVASLDLFPVNANGTALYYIDDISYEHSTPALPNLDVAMRSVGVRTVGITGDEFQIEGEIRNVGLTDITYAEVTWSNGQDVYTDTLSGINVPSLGSHAFSFTTPLIVDHGATIYNFAVQNPNSTVDDNAINDIKNITITGYTPAQGKHSVVEEATGTWCQWCPRGAVFMDLMQERYPDNFVGIAVHNNDPMEVTAYDDGVTSFPGFTGFPSVILDRASILDPNAIEPNMLPRLEVPASSQVSLGAEYDESTRELNISMTIDFTANVVGNWRYNLVLSETGVTGNDNGYNQINAYAGGGSGPMGGYENLPSSVPYTIMVYNHVARAIFEEFNGNGSLPSVITAGESFTFNYSTTLPDTWDYDNMHIVGMVYSSSGPVDNAISNSIDEAIDNGFITSNKPVFRNELAKLYPNPFDSQTYLTLQLDQPTDVLIQVMDTQGKLVAQRDYGTVSGDQIFPFNRGSLSAGLYIMHIQMGDVLISKKLMIGQ